MANALLSAGKSVGEVSAALPSLETLVAAIEARSVTTGPGVEIHVDDADIPF